MKIYELLQSTALTELKMSPGSLRMLASRIPNALVGMEFEMYVPNVELDDETEIEPDYDYDDYIDAVDWKTFRRSIVDFFSGGEFGESPQWIERKLENSVDNDYIEWTYSKFYEWARDGEFEDWYKEENPDEDEPPREGSSGWNNAMDEFRDEKYDEFLADEASIEKWLEDEGIDRFGSFADRYDLSWPYMTQTGGGSESLETVAGDFEAGVGIPVNVHAEYHMARKSTTEYTLEPDSSLDSSASREDRGLEFVSPPLSIDQMIDQLKKVKRWADGYGAYTNASTGLHINVSVPNFDMKKLDYVKLALFVGDDWVAEQFGRLGASWCKSSLEQIKQRIKVDPDKVPAYLDTMKKGFAEIASKLIHSGQTEKYVSINTKDNRIEFRAPGGDWLNTDLNKLINTMLRFVVALDIAMDPNKEKREYATKMYKLIDSAKVIDSTDTVKYFAQYSAGQLPKAALKSFVRNASERRKEKSEKPGSKPGQQIKITYFNVNDGIERGYTIPADSRRSALEQFRRHFPEDQFSVVHIEELNT